MDDPSKPRLNWFERLLNRLSHEPEDREELVAQLRSAFERNLMDADALAMIEGVLNFSEMTVRDVMVPRSQMDVLRADDPIERFLPFVVEMAHSRFPVVGHDKDDVLGVLLAKDLLRYFTSPDTFDLRASLRKPVFVPESKPLNTLLKDFRSARYHMAIVVDEYGGVCGLVTIEDVIEQIVGDIEDEYDFDDSEDNIVAMRNGRYRVKALTEIADFNEFFDTDFSDDEVDTVGGLVIGAFGLMPKRGEKVDIGPFTFTVLRADSRRLHTLSVEPRREPETTD
ncbi:transporter associated domain-containing protein [Crenobacter sp. SG2303]|uniref:Magnesium and cobalt efflux protein CorC n=1 Tax=Crenobacter oryzisoli TaxID=3056844 RepID=A0ABT7XQ32_9NEIS|nr:MULTISPECIES: transporter associated domain-containing protein [unclassified Crenobacter]MDN0075896.1 transporter associated domain-containing protein [Crenobacter sp. SG2303]MDN0085347.1 transporter associated domain-containing protein [Crenobacter sp. SG2305]